MKRQSERLGGGIRALRRARGLTLVALAELSGLSHPFLSQVERGLAHPSMVSLDKIARALGSSQLELMAVGPDLLRGAPDDRPAFVAGQDGEQGPYGLGRARLLVRGTSSFHPMEFTGSNMQLGDYHLHGEDEFVYCLSGEVTVDLGGDGLYHLEVGDSLYFPGGTRHRWYSETGDEYRLLLVKQHVDAADAPVAGVITRGEPTAVVSAEPLTAEPLTAEPLTASVS